MLLENLAALTIEPPSTVEEFFRQARRYVGQIADAIANPVVVAFLTPSGKLVLPIWAAPVSNANDLIRAIGWPEPGPESMEALNDLITFMLIQKYRTGHPEDPVEVANREAPPKWLFPQLSSRQESGFLSASRDRDSQPALLGDQLPEVQHDSLGSCLRRSRFRVRWIDNDGVSCDHHGDLDLTAYTPWFGELNLPAIMNPMERLIIRPIVLPGHETSAHGIGLLVFPIVERVWTQGTDADFVRRVSPFLPHLTLLCARISEELRAQVTSTNPRYSSRYFQIVLGKSLFPFFERVRSGTMGAGFITDLVEQAARSLFDGRAHPVATRRLLREFAASKKHNDTKVFSKEFFGPLVGHRIVEDWFERPDSPPILASLPTKTVDTSPRTRFVATGSPRGGVGKTLLAYNLARTLVQHGQRVLLIELDATNPTIYFIDCINSQLYCEADCP